MRQHAQSFGKDQRLLHKAAFDFVFSDAKSSFCRYFTVLYRPNQTAPKKHPDQVLQSSLMQSDASSADANCVSRLGLIVSRKVSKRAHERNRIKRIARESFRQAVRLKQLDQSQHSIDIIILPKRAAVGSNNSVLFASLEKHWKRIATQHMNRSKASLSNNAADASVNTSAHKTSHQSHSTNQKNNQSSSTTTSPDSQIKAQD